MTAEKAAQEGIAEVLAARGLPFRREARLSPRAIVDFIVGDGVAIEVKLRGWSKLDVLRQLERYAAFDEVREIMLATNLAMGLPAEIMGKPAHIVSLGRAWL